jgi:hypothetical protein
VPLTVGCGTPHVTEKVVVPVPPAGTVTVRGFAALTAQFDATPDNATGLAPAGTEIVVLPLIAIAWLTVPSTVSVYPSASRLEPVELVLTVRLPLPLAVGAQLTEKGSGTVLPADTVTVREFDPLSVQFPARLEILIE